MKKLKLSVLLIAIGTIISKCLGLMREMFLAQKFGAGYISDSFILALSIPNVLITSIAGAIKTNYIPLISDIDEKDKEEEKKFNGLLLTSIIMLSTILVILFFLFTKPIVKIFAVGFNDEGLTYLVNISRITIFGIYFILIFDVLKGHLEFKEKFLGTALQGVLLNISIIIGIYLSTEEKYYILGYGILFGYVLGFLFFAISALRNGFRFKLSVEFKNNTYLKKMIELTLPLLFNSLIWEIHGILDKSIASTIGEGYISSLNYAAYIVNVVVSLFITSVGTVIFPKLISIISKKNMDKVKYAIKSIIKIVILFTIPCTVYFYVFSEDIVRVIFFRGEFELESLYITSNAIKIYSVGILFSCMHSILFKVFYAFKDTKTPAMSAGVSITLNIILSIIGAKLIGYEGIIWATVISNLVSVIMLLVLLNKQKVKILDKEIVIENMKICVANLIMLILVILLYNSKFNIGAINNETISLIIKDVLIAIIGMTIYLVTLKIVKVDLKILKN